MATETKAKAPEWEGKTTVKLKGPTPDQIWPFLEDFCNLHNWLSIVTACYQVEGDLGQPGMVRFVSLNYEIKKEEVWAKEKLLAIDPVERSLSYEIIENNMGFGFYVGAIKVVGVEGGCEIEWSFVSDPIEGWTLDDFVSDLKSNLEDMAGKMEKAVPKA